VKDVVAAILRAKATDKPVKVNDGRGLVLLAKPDGKAFWRFRFFLNQRESMVSLGEYPDVSLKAARDRREEARTKVAEGINPAAERRAERVSARQANANTFQAVAEEWLTRQGGSEGTQRRRRHRLEQFIYPYLGSKPISEITARELLDVLRKMESAGKLHTLKRVLRLCSKVWHHAMIEGHATIDVPHALKDATFKKVATESHAGITDQKQFGELLRKIDGYSSPLTASALKLAALLFVRPGELRKMEWLELDLDGALWTIPDYKMKMRREHLVPLSKQSVKILKAIKAAKTDNRYVFPSSQTEDRPMSENTLNKALRTMGYDNQTHVSHGFRVSASTILHEIGEDAAVIEAQLAHVKGGVAGVYNRAAYLPERTKLMQKWANHLDKLKGR
jgi:integrase